MRGHTRTLSAAAGMALIAGCTASALGSVAGEPPVADDSVDHLPRRQLAPVAARPEGAFAGGLEVYVVGYSELFFRGNSGSAVAVDVGRFLQLTSYCNVPNPMPINGVDIGWVSFGPAIPGAFDYQVLFYQDTIEIDALTAPTTPFYRNLVPNAGFRLEGLTPDWNYVVRIGDYLEINPPLLFDPTKTFAYEVRIFQAGTNLLWPGNAASTSVVVPLIKGPSFPSVGTSDGRRWNDPTFSLDGTRPVNFSDAFPASPTQATNRRDVWIRLRADYQPMSRVCGADFNCDGVMNPDDLGDFITDYYTDPQPPGPGGYALPCPGNAAPYDAGYKTGYTPDGSGQCTPPFPDNLGDYITDYFGGGC